MTQLGILLILLFMNVECNAIKFSIFLIADVSL